MTPTPLEQLARETAKLVTPSRGESPISLEMKINRAMKCILSALRTVQEQTLKEVLNAAERIEKTMCWNAAVGAVVVAEAIRNELESLSLAAKQSSEEEK